MRGDRQPCTAGIPGCALLMDRRQNNFLLGGVQALDVDVQALVVNVQALQVAVSSS